MIMHLALFCFRKLIFLILIHLDITGSTEASGLRRLFSRKKQETIDDSVIVDDNNVNGKESLEDGSEEKTGIKHESNITLHVQIIF